MQPPGPPLPPPPLPPAVAAELAQLEWRLGQVAGEPARRELAELGEAAAVRVLRRIARSQAEVRTLTRYIVSVAVQEMFALNAQDVPTAVSLACNSAPSLSGEAPPYPTRHGRPHSSFTKGFPFFFGGVGGWGRKNCLFFVHQVRCLCFQPPIIFF
jgi:RNA-dependent RNA polymerase